MVALTLGINSTDNDSSEFFIDGQLGHKFKSSIVKSLLNQDPIFAFDSLSSRIKNDSFVNKQVVSNSCEAGNIEAQLRGYVNLKEDWDGYGGVAPDLDVIQSSIDFLNVWKRGVKSSPPKPMLSGDGEVGLYWSKGKRYIEVSFESPNVYSFLVENDGVYSGQEDVELNEFSLSFELQNHLQVFFSDSSQHERMSV